MRIDCIHGYFKFYELASGQVSKFMSVYGFDLVRKDDYYTFKGLQDAPNYSLEGGLYLGARCDVSFSGPQGEVMRANNLVFDFVKNRVVSVDEIRNQVSFQKTEKYYLASGLAMPCAFTDEGLRVTDYSAWYLENKSYFRYSEVTT